MVIAVSSFVDEAEIEVRAGRGGDGCVSFRHEKYIPRGGPDGGDGGNGGHVYLKCDPTASTLSEFRHRRHLRAESGQPGRGANCSGRAGRSVTGLVPPGTMVFDRETDAQLGDLKQPGDTLLVAKGGRGGRGNVRFKSATNQAPRRFDSGGEGEVRLLRLELKVLADVGLVGLPNAGKSTLLSRISSARPRVAGYPFTTLAPYLGVVDGEVSFVVADLPGLIEGAHRGEGLGHEFLRHVERTLVLVHVLDLVPMDGSDPVDNFRLIENELKLYDQRLIGRPRIVAASKLDLTGAEAACEQVKRELSGEGISVVGISAVTGAGIQELVRIVGTIVIKERTAEA